MRFVTIFFVLSLASACGGSSQPLPQRSELKISDTGSIMDAGQSAKELFSSAPKPIEHQNVSIRFWSDPADRLGNPQRVDLFETQFSKADIDAANFKNLNDTGVLNLAKTSRALSGLGAGQVMRTCLKYGDVYRGFCRSFERSQTPAP